MAILAAEQNILPANLFTGFADVPSDGAVARQWWVLRTKSRQEKAIARELSRGGSPFYLPLVPERRTVRARSVEVHLPMFAGYLFLFGTDEERAASLKTNRIVQVLPVADQPRLQRDLGQIERLAASGAALSIESKFQPGQRVRVLGGSLMGLEGVILTTRGINRLFVCVNLIQQGVSLEIDDFMVEPLS